MFSLVLIYLNSTARIYTPSVLKIINRSIQNLLKRPQPTPIDYCKVMLLSIYVPTTILCFVNVLRYYATFNF